MQPPSRSHSPPAHVFNSQILLNSERPGAQSDREKACPYLLPQGSDPRSLITLEPAPLQITRSHGHDHTLLGRLTEATRTPSLPQIPTLTVTPSTLRTLSGTTPGHSFRETLKSALSVRPFMWRTQTSEATSAGPLSTTQMRRHRRTMEEYVPPIPHLKEDRYTPAGSYALEARQNVNEVRVSIQPLSHTLRNL